MWYDQVIGFLNDGTTRIHVNDPVAFAKSGETVDPACFDGGYTAWGLCQISKTPAAWDLITFYRKGRPDPNGNPFA